MVKPERFLKAENTATYILEMTKLILKVQAKDQEYILKCSREYAMSRLRFSIIYYLVITYHVEPSPLKRNKGYFCVTNNNHGN